MIKEYRTHAAGWKNPIMAMGDERILALPKTAFFASQRYPARAVLPSFDWAEQARDDGICVISGFHSLLEQNVRDILLMGRQPLIWAIARKSYVKPPQWAQQSLAEGRLLILSAITQKQQSISTTDSRNRFTLAIADNIVVGHATPNGKIAGLLQGAAKPVQYLAVEGGG